jgi:predicted O-methyltransferase YrrM
VAHVGARAQPGSAVALLPQWLRSLAPDGLRDDVRLRALALAAGAIPPRTMHSRQDVAALLAAARGARRVVEIGVYEGASACALCAALDPGGELHLIDPFGRHDDALPRGWGASERATRAVVARACRRRGRGAASLAWHVARSHDVARAWSLPVDLVFIDGDHSEAGCEQDWLDWSPHVAAGGSVVFHDARADRDGGRGLPGPTAVVARHLRAPRASPDWEIAAEADRTVVVRRRAP